MTKPYDYAAFVAEMRRLHVIGEAAVSMTCALPDDPLFRNWRHEVQDAMDRIKDDGFKVNSRLEYRTFGAADRSSTQRAMVTFETDLADSLGEMAVICANFDKHGEPKRKGLGAKAAQGEATPLEPYGPPRQVIEPLRVPEQVTWVWVKQTMPASWWGFLGTLLLGSFGLGFSFASLGPISQWVSHRATGDVDALQAALASCVVNRAELSIPECLTPRAVAP